MHLTGVYNNKFIFSFLFLFFWIPSKTFAKIFPADMDVLNFTQVMFNYEEFEGADNYIIYIQKTNTDQKTYPMRFKNRSLALLVADGLEFGSDYEWYWEAYAKTKKIFTSENYRFAILSSNLTNKDEAEIRITKNNLQQNQNNIFFLDYLGVAVNRKGKVIWYMPRTLEKKNNGDSTRRSLRITESGTFTYLDNTNCFEKDIFGNILWQTPNDGMVSGSSTEYYHHDFRKLPDQTYLACSYKYFNEPNFFDSSKNWRVRYNTVIQYDRQQNVIWSWLEKDHLDPSLIFEDGDATTTDFQGTHMNGLDYDQKQDALIFSFRNTSRILKVDYKTKNVLFELGRYKSDKKGLDKYAYTLSNQHGPAWMPDGSILVYDNNVNEERTEGKINNPHLLILSQPKNRIQERKLWDYECVSDSFPEGQKGKEGIAFPMYNGNIVASQGSTNRIFEVTRSKKIVWEAFCYENKKGMADGWQPFVNYRTFPASSLFPTYFTLQHIYDNQQRVLKNKIILNNDGTDDKTFIIKQYKPNQKAPVFTTKIPIKAGARYILNYKGDNEGYLKIHPANSEDLTKQLEF